MAEFPYFKFYAGDYLADTMHLTTIEHGAYLLLLITAWRMPGCVLPDDDNKLAKYTRLRKQQWARIRAVMLEFWTIDNGVWSNKRLMKEFESCTRHRNGSAHGGHVTALKNKKTPPAPPHRLGAGSPQQPEPESESKKEEENTPPPPSKGPAKANGGRVVSLEDEKVNIIVADYDNAIEEIYGASSRRPWPDPTDRVHAKRWVEMGVTPQIVADVFRQNLHRSHAQTAEPFRTLSYFDRAVQRVVDAARKGEPEAPRLHETPEEKAEAKKGVDTILRRMIANGVHPQYTPDDIPDLESQGVLLKSIACERELEQRKQNG